MASFRWLLSPKALLLLGGLHLHSHLAQASSVVNVALKASFASAPYLVELLEAVADEQPSAYFPIIDRIAAGYFDKASTDEQLYNTFLKLLKDDKLLQGPEALSSFQLGLSIHNSAPRIEAQYQYYRTSIEPLLERSGGKPCESWLQFSGKQYCSPSMDVEDGDLGVLSTKPLPFDRLLGDDSSALPAILYADITSDSFKKFHKTLSAAARDGKSTYRVRHKPSSSESGRNLGIAGYGVALDLKRTDYIVIDDRQAEETPEPKKKKKSSKKGRSEDTLENADGSIEDLKPLSGSQLADLDLKAASYVLNSGKPLDTLLKLTQDFPKHSSWLVDRDASESFLQEHKSNRATILPAGFSTIWINGVQLDVRKVDAFSMLDHLRKERKLVAKFADVGLSPSEAIQLLSHSAISEAQRLQDPPRYDWRDTTEGGNVIIWLNNIEKDRRYEGWPTELTAYMHRGQPGQLPAVRRDLHNAIVPVDFSDPQQVYTVVETIQDLIKRAIPCRWGLVPVIYSKEATEQAQVIYHLLETHGLTAVVRYLENSLHKKTIGTGAIDTRVLGNVVEDHKVKANKEKLSPDEILATGKYSDHIQNAQSYLARLGVGSDSESMFVNGVPVKQDEGWLSSLSQRVSMDLQIIQKAIWDGVVEEEHWLPDVWLVDSSPTRNPLIIPEDESEVKLFDLGTIFTDNQKKLRDSLPQVQPAKWSGADLSIQLLVVGDFGTSYGLSLAATAIEFRKEHGRVNLVFLQNSASSQADSKKTNSLLSKVSSGKVYSDEQLTGIAEDLRKLAVSDEEQSELKDTWADTRPIAQAFGLAAGKTGLVLNGRLVGPIPTSTTFNIDDFKFLYNYELSKRIQPAIEAVAELKLSDKIKTPFDAAKLCSLLAVAPVSDVPEGAFESAPPIRTSVFNDWECKHTSITLGDNSTAVIQLVAVIDPATEIAQRWVPIIKVLSELGGVSTRIFLNPQDKLQDLPVKRFYRSVLAERPTFEKDGSLRDLTAKFEGMPRKTLMTMAMDVPPSWLVASKESIYDLDNIKLSSVADDTDVDATYELESILIEGHSRDATVGKAPRGAQLVLSTTKEPHFADTIIMANLGYFQFKANPGYYKIKLQPGPSEDIFHIDTIGVPGHKTDSDDDSTDVTMMSFQGVTLFPRLSRKPGMEEEDVLGDAKEDSGNDFLAQGAKVVDGWLAKAGVNIRTGKYLNSASHQVTKLFGKFGRTDVKGSTGTKQKGGPSKNADINIFSVASGHLYERMLNIMMVSVMRHTNQTVKFWFIEQFLSPSFKSFVPTLAKEYGFEYELVGYKWPHWLRAQKEKQREIWGYKILFLDVLFPLDLDKVIFVDSDQIVRTDMYELVQHDLEGAPYGFTPMCDSRTEMEGFRFWKQGYWKNFLRGQPYHISALYVVDLKRFRQIAAGDRLRQQYHALSADPGSLANLDQDLPNNMQMVIPIHSLPQDWLWCETWCSDEALTTARTIDLCNNPLTKEPKLDRARRQIPEWTVYDDEIAALARRTDGSNVLAGEGAGRVQEEEQIAKDMPVPQQEKEGKPAKPVRDEL